MPIHEDLTKKAGPLPIWAWASAAGGLVVVLEYVQRRRNGASAQTTDTSTASSNPSDSGYVSGYGDYGSGSGSGGGTSSSIPSSTPAPVASPSGQSGDPYHVVVDSGYLAGGGIPNPPGNGLTGGGTVPISTPTPGPTFTFAPPVDPEQGAGHPIANTNGGLATRDQLNQAQHNRNVAQEEVAHYSQLVQQYHGHEYVANLEAANKKFSATNNILQKLKNQGK